MRFSRRERGVGLHLEDSILAEGLHDSVHDTPAHSYWFLAEDLVRYSWRPCAPQSIDVFDFRHPTP